MKIIITEKPSVARDIAAVLNISQKEDGYFFDQEKDTAITWAFGHLLQIASPAELGYTSWAKENLPMLPDTFPVVPRTIKKPGGRQESDLGILKQLDIIRSLFDVASEIIVATDAGREGELIFRYIYEYLNCKKPFKRLWISSLTNEAIEKGFRQLKDGADFDSLFYSAKARAEADWLVGLNATQSLSVASKKQGGVLSLGRVQTPTLAMICQRYNENKKFKSNFYYKVIVGLDNSEGIFSAKTRVFDTLNEAQTVIKQLNEFGEIPTEKINETAVSLASPLLYDLTYLQQEANIKYGYSADNTLKVAQKLYEGKLISYPRTASRYISEDVFQTVPDLLLSVKNLDTISYKFPMEILDNATNNLLNKKAVDDTKITDHHAILPTGNAPNNLSEMETAIFELITSKMLQAFLPAARQKRYHGAFLSGSIELNSVYTEIISKGWLIVRNETIKDEEESEEINNEALKYCIEKGSNKIVSTENQKLKTKPKPLLTEATLLKAMQNCSQEISDEILSEAIKETGLGTPATRASIIELLFTRGYCERKGKSILPTQKGLEVYSIIRDMKISMPLLTGEWENKLAQVENGQLEPWDFINGIKAYTTDIVIEILYADYTDKVFSNDSESLMCPKCKANKIVIMDKVAKCSDFTNCDFVIFRSVGGNTLTKATISDLIKTGKSKKLKGFKGKSEKVFDAVLVLEYENWKVRYDF